MLTALSVRDLVLVTCVELELGPGLSVLTGETGAGKSIILDALGLALGARGSPDLIRHGAEKAVVAATFSLKPTHGVWALLEDFGLEGDGETLVLRRILAREGGGRAFVNDQTVGVGVLRTIGEGLVEIHGQHADRAFVSSEHHGFLLDAFCDLQSEVRALGNLHGQIVDVRKACADLSSTLAAQEAERAFRAQAIEEIEAFAPEDGEEDALVAQRSLLQNAEHFSELLTEARALFSPQSQARSDLSSLFKRLERRREQAFGHLDGVCETVSQVLDGFFQAEEQVEDARRDLGHDPLALERCEDRLFGLRGLARKYRVAPSGLLALAEEYRASLSRWTEQTDLLKAHEQERTDLEEEYRKRAEEISIRRKQGADGLARAVMSELSALRLEKALFKIEVDADPERFSHLGFDRVSFLVSMNGLPTYAPIGKVASGGELSRLMLALKVVLASRICAPTLVFDEIDTGMSGAIADVIGKRLWDLSQTVQVLAITHSPQVASRAGEHFLITKEEASGFSVDVATFLRRLTGEKRQEEVARMLSGAHITGQARAQAQHLLWGSDGDGLTEKAAERESQRAS